MLLVQNGIFDIRLDLLKSKNKSGLSHDHLRSKRVYLSPESAKFLKKIMQNENRLDQLNHIVITAQWLSLVTGKFNRLEENLSQAQIGLENREGTINKKAGLNNKKTKPAFSLPLISRSKLINLPWYVTLKNFCVHHNFLCLHAVHELMILFLFNNKNSRNEYSFLAWESSRHLATSPLVSSQNDIWETSAEIPYWWLVTSQIWVVILIGHATWEIDLNQSETLPRSG